MRDNDDDDARLGWGAGGRVTTRSVNRVFHSASKAESAFGFSVWDGSE